MLKWAATKSIRKSWSLLNASVVTTGGIAPVSTIASTREASRPGAEGGRAAISRWGGGRALTEQQRHDRSHADGAHGHNHGYTLP